MTEYICRNLIRQFEECFVNIPFPDWDDLTYARYVWEFDEFLVNGVPSDWAYFSADFLECHKSIFSFLKPRGFLFFFPAFVVAGLDEYIKVSEEYRIIGYKLSPFDDIMLRYCIKGLAWQFEKYAAADVLCLFSGKQIDAIRNLLDFLLPLFPGEPEDEYTDGYDLVLSLLHKISDNCPCPETLSSDFDNETSIEK